MAELWWWGMSYGTFAGITIGYLTWRLPVDVKRFQAWRRNREQQEVSRIRGGFRPWERIPNTAPPPTLPERIVDGWRDFWLSGSPLTPERHAQNVYEELVVGLR